MISFRQADLIDTFKSKQPRTYACRLEVVWPRDNASDRRDHYMMILSLELSPTIPLDKYMKIRDKVETAIAPYKATIDGETEDGRKVFSKLLETGKEFMERVVGELKSKLEPIAVNGVVTNLGEYHYQQVSPNPNPIDRVSINFFIEV